MGNFLPGFEGPAWTEGRLKCKGSSSASTLPQLVRLRVRLLSELGDWGTDSPVPVRSIAEEEELLVE